MSQTESSKKSVSALNFQPPLPSVSKFIWVICIGLLVLLAWAWFFELEEVSTGSGKVIPSSKEQSIQSLEGGILTKLYVSEGKL
jgi:adhesin transport system membrane fusion protein